MKKALLGVLVIAFLLRVLDLNLYPVGFTPDEASFGYDAYSILKTGSDQWGHMLPQVLESFGDFKAPLYSYISVPFIALLGLTKFAIRLPNALVGVLAVYATYLLSKEILALEFANFKKKGLGTIPVFSAFLLAVSPWHFMMSRGAFEANLTTFMLPLGAYLFLKGLKIPKFLNYSALVLGLNLFSYHSARLVTPLVVFVLVVLYFRELTKLGFHKKVYPALIFLFFILLTVVTFFQGGGRRVADVSIAGGALEAQAEARLDAINSGMSPALAKIFHNKYLVIADRFIFNYQKYASVKFLFKEGAGETTYGMIPGTPLLYLWEAPLLLAFVLLFIKNPKNRGLLFVLIWIVIGFIPASLTTGVGRAANRAEVVLPSLQIASGLGILALYSLTKNKKLIKTTFVFLTMLLFFNSLMTYKNYKASSLLKSGPGMLSGNLEMADFVSENYSDFKIVVNRSLSEPHIYIAFSSKWNPSDYQNASEKWTIYKDQGLSFLDQLGTYNLGKYTFTDFEYEDYIVVENVLLVGRPDDFPKDVVPLKKFTYPNGMDSIYIVSPNKQVYAKTN